jgi:disease resistance protein RPM1
MDRYFFVIDDFWEPQSLERIKLALVGNNCGSRVIITTRKLEVAKEADEVYKLGPLSFDNSRKLFYTRLFGGEDKCPNNHPVELSDTILKKCGGIPLAIITMSSFLLGKSRKEWIEVCNSPGFYQDNKNDRHMENTMHILSLSYYDLPSHPKTCLLYLSVFPEDTLIDKDSLIWMWIAEGFVEKKPGCGLFEVGEKYFLELINRSMIQGVDFEVCGMVDGCRVHDMVLDLIVSMSREENFASVDGTLAENHTRRFALSNRDLDLPQDTGVNLPQVRSFIVLHCDIFKWALHPRLKLIRVLALVDCTFRGEHKLEHIGNLLHLRYLGLRDNIWTGDLPEGIGALKFLQTLNLEDTDLELPCSIGRLTQLVCLRARETRAPDGVIGMLTSLEELQIAGPRDDGESWSQFVKDLGNLCELRVLKINGASELDESTVYENELDESMERNLIQSLGKLQKMQHLALNVPIDSVNMNAWDVNMDTWDAAVPSPDLRCLFLPSLCFPKLPSWINSAQLSSLSHLDIYLAFMDEQGFKALGGLPKLCYLRLLLERGTVPQTEAHGCFQNLRSFVLPKSMVQFVANEDSSDLFASSRKQRNNCSSVLPAVVMPNLEELEIRVNVEELTKKNIVGCEDLGLQYLPSLQRVKGVFNCPGAYEDEVEREEAALRHAIQVHPNCPALQIKRKWEAYLKRYTYVACSYML